MSQDDRHHRDYQDFFKDKPSESDSNPSNSREETHYIYHSQRTQPSAEPPIIRESGNRTELNLISGVERSQAPALMPQQQSWQYPVKRQRMSLKGAFASFMAGILVMGSLMFAADRMNLFTSDEAAITAASEASSTDQVKPVTSSNGGSNISNASVNLVRPNTIADIVEQSSPAVVLVKTYSTGNNGRSMQDDFFEQFFGDFYNQQQPESGRRETGIGTGFIFESSGYILTNQHVIESADEIEVVLEGRKEPYKAKLLGSDRGLDLAVLKISGDKAFPTLPLGDSDTLRVGDWVTAIGNPVGFEHTVSVGVLSAKERSIKIPDNKGGRSYDHLLQTDASINPGNSGGPLLNLDGQVIGINTAVSTDAQGIGFAIPTSTITSVLEKLKNNEKLPKPYIGIGLSDIDKSWVEDLKLKNNEGIIVSQVYQDSPASRAGLQTYDVVTKYNGTAVKSTEDFIKLVQASKVGDRVKLTVIRDGKTLEVGVIIGNSNQ